MRKFIFALMASLLSCSAVSAFWQEAVDSSLEIGVGYRQDNIKWKRESSNGSSSYSSDCSSSSKDSGKIKSDLKWKDLNIWVIEGRGKYITCDNIYLRGAVDYGWITSGKIKHSLEVDGECESFDNYFSNGDKHRVKGNVWDAKLALGYQFKWCDEALSLSPVVGYSWHGTELRNGKHDDYNYGSSSYSDSCSYSSSSDSSSEYSSYSSSCDKHKIHQRWVGPFIGIDLDYRVCCDWNLFLSYEYHWADYHAKERHSELFFDHLFNGNCCFEDSTIRIHGKNGSGNVLNMGVQWDLCDCWTVGLRGEFQWWEVSDAREHRKLCEQSLTSHAELEAVLKTRIKEVTWNSGSLVLDFGMVF